MGYHLHIGARTRTLVASFILLSTSFSGFAPKPATAAGKPEPLVILSTTDVKGKTSPCGCQIPKGGLSRQASYSDSIKAQYRQVLVVDNGGFCPEVPNQYEVAEFLMDAMKRLNHGAVGLGDRDIKYGYAWLKSQQQRTGLPVVCANLLDKKTGKPAFDPFVITKVGDVKVGVFGLITDKSDLGPARDSLTVQDPMVAAKRTILEMRRQGATVVVLLSQLGKVESEDLTTTVDGMDAVIVGRNVPLIQKGRLIKNTVMCYGGEQGQYMGRTVLTLDARGKVTTGENDMSILSPAVGEKAEVLELVKNFEDSNNERMRKTQTEAEPTR